MKSTTAKIAFLTAAGCLSAASAHALDGQLVLDRLVQKGVLSQEEADAIVKADAEKQKAGQTPPTVLAGPRQTDVTKLTISGRVQAQAKFLTRDSHSDATDRGQTAVAGAELRRLNLDFDATLPKGFTVFGSLEVNAGNGGGNNASSAGYAFLIDKAGVAYDGGDYGKFTAALQKSRFALEEYTSSSNLCTIERSAVSNYFANTLQLGGRHTGFYWESRDTAKTGLPGFGLGVANAYQGAFNSTTTPNGETYAPAFYANIDRLLKFGANVAWYNTLNATYSEANINQLAGLPGSTNTNPDFDTRTFGFEFASKLTAGDFTVVADFLAAQIENGRFAKGSTTDARSALPWGATLVVAYRITPEIEPVAQIGYVDGDGRAVPDGTFRDLANDGNSVSPGAGLGTFNYDRAANLFVGVNWYITPKSLKFTAGFDSVRFKGRANNDLSGTKQEEDVYGGRMQIQALF